MNLKKTIIHRNLSGNQLFVKINFFETVCILHIYYAYVMLHVFISMRSDLRMKKKIIRRKIHQYYFKIHNTTVVVYYSMVHTCLIVYRICSK